MNRPENEKENPPPEVEEPDLWAPPEGHPTNPNLPASSYMAKHPEDDPRNPNVPRR